MKKKKKTGFVVTPEFAFTPSAEYRPAPTNFKAVEENGGVTLTWDAQPDAVGYNLWRSINGRKTVVIAGTKETHYVDSDVIHGFACYYGLHSRDAAG